MVMDLKTRKDENAVLSRQLDTVTEYIDILSGFLEDLRDYSRKNGCMLCGNEPGIMVEASTQTDYPGQSQIEDAFYFLEERPPAFSIFHADGGYTTPGGTRITGALRREFYALRGRYRDQQEATS